MVDPFSAGAEAEPSGVELIAHVTGAETEFQTPAGELVSRSDVPG